MGKKNYRSNLSRFASLYYVESKKGAADFNSIRKKIRKGAVFLQRRYCGLSWSNLENWISHYGAIVRRRRKTISISPISPIHFNVINVPIACFVSWSNLQLPRLSIHQRTPFLFRASHPRNKRVVRQKHRSVVTGTVCVRVWMNTTASANASAHNKCV